MVFLGGNGRGKVDIDYFEKRVISGEEFLYNNFEELFVFEVFFFGRKFDFEFFEEFGDFVFFEVYDRVKEMEDGVKDEYVECLFNIGFGRFGLFFSFGVEVIVILKFGYEFSFVNIEFFGVLVSEVLERESLIVEIGIEGDGILFGVDYGVFESGIGVSGNDNVDGFNGLVERLVKVFFGNL